MLNYWNYWLFITTDKSSNRLEWLLTKTCTENIFMSHCNTVYYTSWLQVNLNDISDFYKNTHQLHLTQERNVVKEEEGLDDPSLFLPLFRAEIHHSVQKRAEEKPSGSREKWREKEKEVGRVPVGLVWGWKLIIAALMRSGMPGDSGCSSSPCCGNIKRNRGPPSRYNCCGDLSKGLRSLCRNLCNPDCSTLPVIFNLHV